MRSVWSRSIVAGGENTAKVAVSAFGSITSAILRFERIFA